MKPALVSAEFTMKEYCPLGGFLSNIWCYLTSDVEFSLRKVHTPWHNIVNEENRMTDSRKPITLPFWLHVVTYVGIPVLGFLGMLVVNGYNIANTMADKPYVDKRVTESMKYTDQKSAEVMREAFEHSDTNRREITLQIEKMNGDMKGSQIELTTKVNMILETLQRPPARR